MNYQIKNIWNELQVLKKTREEKMKSFKQKEDKFKLIKKCNLFPDSFAIDDALKEHNVIYGTNDSYLL